MSNNVGREDYCDPRAKKFYSWVYTGTRTESGHHWSWNSTHEELQPTAVHTVDRGFVCAHCGHRALPIQKQHRRGIYTTYSDAGYTCVCKGAMDECDWRAQWNALKAKHDDEEAELLKLQPQLPNEVRKQVVATRLAQIANDFERHGYLSHHDCDNFGIDFGCIPEGEHRNY